jgi:phenylalanyl-tRNA synthetase alpha chain
VHKSEAFESIQELSQSASVDVASVWTLKELEEVRVNLLGRKEGKLTLLMRRLPELPPEDRPRFGQLANRLKNELSDQIERRRVELEAAQAGVARPRFDLSLPGRRQFLGVQHPITRTTDEIVDIFVRMGFREELGPEIEDDWHNYTALNFKPDHPARDEWAGFYLRNGKMLRSHTSPVQIRVMERQKPPVRIVVPGRCFRPDPFDASHAPVFHQVEGLYVDEGVSMAHLKGTLDRFVREMFGPEVKTRFVPSYFPFTEPSAELACSCMVCQGRGCPTCKRTGWLELMGCGMVHPKVLKNVGYDPERYTGYAFGMGVERTAMVKHRIDDLRLLFENDVRFLRQF